MINTKPAKVEMIDEMKLRNCIFSLVSRRQDIHVWWNTKRLISQNINAKVKPIVYDQYRQ